MFNKIEASKENKNRIFLLTPLFFMIHNLEEGYSMKGFLQAYADLLPYPMKLIQFHFALIGLTSLGFIMTYLLWKVESKELYNRIMNAFIGLVFVNAFLPHILGAVILGGYTPGLVTSIVLYVPFGIYAYRQLLIVEKVSRKKAVFNTLLGVILGLVLTILLLILGSFIG